MKQKPTSLDRKSQKSVQDAVDRGVINSKDYTRPMNDVSLGDIGLLGAQPYLTGGAQIGQNGGNADGIWAQQYSTGGSILDALLDKPPTPPSMPPPPKPAPTINVREMQDAQDGVGEGWYETLFTEKPAFRGFVAGVILMLILNKYA